MCRMRNLFSGLRNCLHVGSLMNIATRHKQSILAYAFCVGISGERVSKAIK